MKKLQKVAQIRLDYKDRDVALTLFALGAGVNFVMRKMHRRGKPISHQAISKLQKKLTESGAIQECKDNMTKRIPLIVKYVRILHLQEEVERVEKLLEIGGVLGFPELEKLKALFLRQIAEEMGDIKKGGVNVPITINTGASKPEYAPEDERRALLRVLSEKAPQNRN